MNYEIGKRVRKIRLQKGISQEQFGELIGIKKAAVSKIENGDNSLSRSNLISICKQFNINEEWLLYGKGEMFTDLAKIQRKFINTLISLDKEEWIVLDRFMKKYHFNQK